MKRFASAILLSLFLVTLFSPIAVSATPLASNQQIIYLEDGYITVTLDYTESRAATSKTGSKTFTYYDGNDREKWKAVLRGTFAYTGTSATCTAASCDVTITDTVWYVVSKDPYKSGNSAVCDLTMGRKFLGISIAKETVNMRLTCDASGNLS